MKHSIAIIGFFSLFGLLGCGNSPDTRLDAANSSGSNNPANPNTGDFISDPSVTNTVTTVCGVESDSYHFCDRIVESPAPPTATFNPPAVPGANGVDDCAANWDTSGGTTDIALTVFIPAHNAGESFPLVLHSHGWGGSRVTTPAAADPGPDANTFEGIADMTQKLWREDYIVISFDQRGWGDSAGEAMVIDPCYEGVDAMAIIDWAMLNLPISRETPTDPIVGAIGGSYGGAYQMMLAAMDDRLDSIMPVATWNSLAAAQDALLDNAGLAVTQVDGSSTPNVLHNALITNETVKRGYVNGLCVLATTAQANLDPRIQDACNAIQVQGAETGNDIDTAMNTSYTGSATEMRGLFARNSMGNANLRPNRPDMTVDAFFVQGMRDMVFDGVEAFDNYNFFAAESTGNVHLMTTDGGHMLTTFESAMLAVSQTQQYAQNYQVQGLNSCGDIDMFQAMIAWLDSTLRPNHTSSVAVTIPDICISLTSNAAPDATLKRDSMNNGLTINSIVGNGVAAFEFGSSAAPIVINVTTAPNDDPTDSSKILGSPRLFVPLTTAMSGGEYIAGVPIITEMMISKPTLALPTENPTAFMAIGIQKADGSFVEVDEQVTAVLRAPSATDADIAYTNVRMPMVADALEAGDVVGLLVYRRHGQFQLVPGTSTEYTANQYNVFGKIAIPIFAANDMQIAPAIP